VKGFAPVSDQTQQFGDRRVTVKSVRIVTTEGGTQVLHSCQSCRIDIILQAHEDIQYPIIGFIVKDRLGREFFGENTAFMHQSIPSLMRGRNYLASFWIESWPNINEDEYLLTVAVADGSLEEHDQCHYVHDALVFQSIPVKRAAGIFSLVDSRFEIQQF